MKIPLSWLKEFVDISVSVDELTRRLSLGGLEVVDVRFVGGEGSALPWDPEKILVANIVEVKAHPNADRLVLADVDYGGAELHTVVTGAPNLYSYKGAGPLSHPLKSVFAREGVQLYDGHTEGNVVVTLKGRPVRGVMSDAMLCSEKELGISDEHEGILLLEDDAPVGMPLYDFIGEVVIEVDITPNYARALSIVGVAREVAALLGTTLRLPDPQVQMDGPALEGRVQVSIEDPALCPRFTVGLIEGVTISKSPQWMQRRLSYAGMRPINVVVDVSNYVMLEWGAPSHAYDADKVQEWHFVVRQAQPSERLITLDGRDRDLTPSSKTGLTHAPLLVCDPNGPLGIAGVMGGEESEVRDDTTSILLETAIWEPTQIRRTARTLKLPSEASRRFERGVDYEVPPIAQRRALELMQAATGGTVAHGIIDVYPQPWQPLVLDLLPSEITRIVGIQLSAAEIANLLDALGFGCAIVSEQNVRVTVPSFRQDVTILADLCEEVARVYGYDNIPSTRLADELPKPDSHPDQVIDRQIHTVLVGCGLSEVITHSLIDMELVARVQPSEAVADRHLRLSNPLSPERTYMRRSLLPSVLTALAANVREQNRVLLFEVGNVYLPLEYSGANGEWLPDEPRHVALAMAGPRSALQWSGQSTKTLDFFDIKGVVETLFERLGLTEQVRYVPLTDDERFHPGRAAAILLERPASNVDAAQASQNGKRGRGTVEILSERVGVFGELHPAVRDRLDLQTPRAVAAEINVAMLIHATEQPAYRVISRYPVTMQDLAVVVAADVSTDRVAALIQRGAGDTLEALTLFDVYTGPQVGEGNRSLAYRLTFRAPDRTLSDEAVNKVRTKVVKLLQREVGATIRG